MQNWTDLSFSARPWRDFKCQMGKKKKIYIYSSHTEKAGLKKSHTHKILVGAFFGVLFIAFFIILLFLLSFFALFFLFLFARI